MKTAIEETYRRREKQIAHNERHGISPRSIIKEIKDMTERVRMAAEDPTPYAARRSGRRDR